MEWIIVALISIGAGIFTVEYQHERNKDQIYFQSPAVQGHPYLSNPKITSEGEA